MDEHTQCNHENVVLKAAVTPQGHEMLCVTILIHCEKCGCDWDVFRVPLDAKQKLHYAANER